MMWILDYDGALFLKISENDTNAFLGSVFYKISLKRYIKEVFPGFIRFKPALTYLDYKKVISLCENEATKKNFPIVISNELQEYIESRELHLEIRSRLGIELKEHNQKLEAHFEEYRSSVDSNMARKLREKQMWDSFFMCAMQKSANFSVPGSGKTASVLGMYAHLKAKGLIKRIIVISPKNAFGSWVDEFKVCFEDKDKLKLFNIHDTKYKNTAQRRTALQYDSGICNLILVNYETVSGVLDILRQLIDATTLLVFDEVHRVKRIGGEYAENALKLARTAHYVVAMTGTPIPNSYTDIYNLLHILFPDEYEEFFDFSVAMLKQARTTDIETVNDKLQPFFCRTTKNQLGVPDVNDDIVEQMMATETENKLLNILKMKYRKNKLALLIRILQLESNPKMLLNSLDLKEFSYLLDDAKEIDEIDFVDYSEDVKRLIESCDSTTKFTQCIELVKQLVNQGKPVIVWCMFVDSITSLASELNKQGVCCKCIFGEVALDERQTIIESFKNEKIQVLITNPHTLAESVSLHTVCHDAIYFEYSYNLVHLLQSKDRIHRLGISENQYTQYYYLQMFYETETNPWSMEEAVYGRLKEKEQIMLDAIDNHVLEALPSSEEDLDTIFSKLL